MDYRTIAPAALALALTGCATFSPDGGMDAVRELAQARIGQGIPRVASDSESAALVEARLAAPLSAESAVAIALLNNQGLRAAYAELGIAEADLVQAGRFANPGISLGVFRRGSEREIERKVGIDVIGLVTMPLRLRVERAAFDAAQMRAAREVVRVADEARRAWVDAVAAAESAVYAERVKDSADAGAELAQGMLRAGNFSRLAQSREQLFQLEAAPQLARSRHAAAAAKERLARALGLSRDQLGFRLPERLPDIPATVGELANAENTALLSRLDILAARCHAEAVARSLGLTRATRFVNVLHLGYERDTSNEAPRRTGYEIELQVPIFDTGDAKVARAEAVHRQAVARLSEIALRARSEVREAHAAYRAAHEVARKYREEILPLRKLIAEENLLRYNGMLISVFDLLADAREQAAAVRASVDAAREFWIADANLEMALLTGSPDAVPPMQSGPTPAAAAPGRH